MVSKIIMLLCMLPVLPIIYVMLANETKPKKNIILGVTLPYEARQDKGIGRICKCYRKNLLLSGTILFVLGLLSAAIPSFSIFMTCILTWLDLVIAVPIFLYISAHKKIRRLKQENLWYSERADMKIAEVKPVSAPLKKLSAGWFIPPIVISLIPVVIALFQPDNAAKWWTILGYACNAMMVLVFGLLHRLIYRQGMESVDENTDLTIALTRIRRYQWSKCWLWISYLTALFSIGFWLTLENPIALLLITLIYTFLLPAAAVRTEFTTRRAQEQLTADSGKLLYKDEDEHWIYGMFYCNPNDRHFIVNNRIGLGTSVNIAKLPGKILMVFSAVILLILPFIGGWCMVEEFTPIRAALTGNTLLVEHIGTAFQAKTDDITDVELWNTLPDYHKIVGTSMEHLLKGKFRLTGMYDCRLYLDPQNSPFLKLELKDGSIVIIGSSDDSVIQIYHRLCP